PEIENLFAFELKTESRSYKCQILYNPKLLSIKTCFAPEKNQPCLSYCPRFISLGHELIHVVRSLDGNYYKDVPLSLTPSLRAYTSVEELYTIWLQKHFSENLLNLELGYKVRLGHAGISIIDTHKQFTSKELETIQNLKRALILALIDLN